MCVCVYTHTQHTQHTHTHTHTHTHMKVHYSSQCVMGIKTDKEINRVEQSPEIDTHICGLIHSFQS